MVYQANEERYKEITIQRSGRSGLQLPAISLGLWHNFGGIDLYENGRAMVRHAFDRGIFHFDLANNYGPPAGSAEEAFGRMLRDDLKPYRDELIISSKAGFYMWKGPFGEWGSRKYLIASLDQSLKRMGLDYVDIFYSHRPDPNTPMEETIGALDHIVRSGKAIYAAISNYDATQTEEAIAIAKRLGTPLVLHQPRYSMLDRWIEDGLQDVLAREQIGSIAYSPLAQGLLSDKYLGGSIPSDSRVAKPQTFLNEDRLQPQLLSKLEALNLVARERGQSLAQMALSWVLREGRVTSALIGTSKVAQIDDSLKALDNVQFSAEQLAQIDHILNKN